MSLISVAALSSDDRLRPCRSADGPARSSGSRSISFSFALTLLGVAVFHHHTLRVALTGLVTIAIYKIIFTGFKTGPGATGFLFHLEHHWVILVNLLCLLTGFALLSRHFEKSHLPVVLPRFLPQEWKGAFASTRPGLGSLVLSR